MNPFTSRFSKVRFLFAVVFAALFVCAAASAQTSPSPYVGRMSPDKLNKIAGAQFRSDETYNLSEMLNAKTASPLTAHPAVAAANSIAVSSSVQTLAYLTDLAPATTVAPTQTPANIDPVYSPSESHIVFASNRSADN